MGRAVTEPPRIYCVNWFRKDASGRYLWPGYGENMRVLQWIVGRVAGRAAAVQSPLGWVPRREDLFLEGLDALTERDFEELMSMEGSAWLDELDGHEEFFAKLHPQLPGELEAMCKLLHSGFERSPGRWTPPRG